MHPIKNERYSCDKEAPTIKMPGQDGMREAYPRQRRRVDRERFDSKSVMG